MRGLRYHSTILMTMLALRPPDLRLLVSISRPFFFGLTALLLAAGVTLAAPATAQRPANVADAAGVVDDASVVDADFIDASELRAGDSGYGLTVLEGDTIVRFPVSYIGRLENAMVQQDMILIRLHGAPFQHTGVIAGMSGSPVYFRDRLLGALAYGWAFSKDPIAGVTPIGKMVELLSQQSAAGAIPTETGWTPLQAPLSVAGLPPTRLGEAWKRIDALGFQAASGGRSAGGATRLEPGSAVGVRLVDGDLSLTAIGTVTWVSESGIVAFGHPFLNRGLSVLPMTGAHIAGVMPVQSTSFKLGSATDDLGAILRDATPGISGRTGPAPSMIPLTVELAAPWGARRYQFRIARDEVISPQLFDIAWASAAEAGLFAMGPAGVTVEVEVEARGRVIRLRDRGVVTRSPIEVMPTLPVEMLYANPFMRFHPDSVSVRVAVSRDLREREILDARPLRVVVAPGDSVPIEIEYQIYDMGRVVERLDVPVPPGAANGNLTITISGGRGLSRKDLAEPTTVDGLLDRLAAYESKDMLVVQLTQAGGRRLEVDGGILPDLPPGMRRLQRGSDRGPTSRDLTIPMDLPVSGAASVTVEVRR
jgi:hypothetical protein